MDYLDQINIKAVKHKALADVDYARQEITRHIAAKSYKGGNLACGCTVRDVIVYSDRVNIVFTNDYHLTIAFDEYVRDTLELTNMDMDDAVASGLVPAPLLEAYTDKKRAYDLVADEEQQVKELCKLVDKLGKDTILKLLGAS